MKKYSMRILIVTSDYPPEVGGMSEYSEAWAAELALSGCEVNVLARKNPAYTDSVSDADGHVSASSTGRAPRVPADRVEWKSGPLRDPWGARAALEKSVLHFRPDIVMAHTWIGWGPALVWTKGRIGIPYVLSAHGAEILGPMTSPYYRWMMTQSFRGADAIFAVSSFTADHVATLGLSRERIEVIGNGVDVERFTPGAASEKLVTRFGLCGLGSSVGRDTSSLSSQGSLRPRFPGLPTSRLRTAEPVEGRRILLTVGGLVERKGHDTVIEALAILAERYPSLTYLVAGGWALNSSREGYLRDLVARKGLESRVVFTGFVSDEELPEIYRLADIFVMTGREVKEKGWVEGFGISYLEAAASGLPIVAADTGGVREAVTTKNSIMISPDDPSATASAIAKLLDDDQLRVTMAQASMDWARACAWSKRVAIGREIMERIMAG